MERGSARVFIIEHLTLALPGGLVVEIEEKLHVDNIQEGAPRRRGHSRTVATSVWQDQSEP